MPLDLGQADRPAIDWSAITQPAAGATSDVLPIVDSPKTAHVRFVSLAHERHRCRDAGPAGSAARIHSVDGDLDELQAARSRSETLHTTIWSTVERVDRSGTSPAVLSSLITAANELIDLHELRLASIQNFLPVSLLLLLLGMATIAVGFLAWSFGATGQGGRTAMLVLALLIAAVLALIMDVNRPQRGSIGVGVSTLERVQESISAPMP
jgi:hypothetical protein